MPSRSVASTFNGVGCLEGASFGFVHGPSPAVAEVRISGQIPQQIGREHAIQIDQSLFVGYVTNMSYSYDDNTTIVRMVDWRDRLRDILIFACWNMSEDSGLWYHIEEADWKLQAKTYISTEKLRAANVRNIAIAPDDEVNDEVVFNGAKFKSSWAILTYIARRWGIRIVCDAQVKRRLQTTIPDNVDANSGSYLVDIIEYVLSKASCQMSCYGRNILAVTIRGLATAGVQTLVRACVANPCSIGAEGANIGIELNEQGRRVHLIGEPNQHEWAFPCIADWNPNWTFDFVYNGASIAILLEATGLTGQSLVKQLPALYHDESYWPLDNFDNRDVGAVAARRTRNDMTIDEYRMKVAWKVYRVDPRVVVKDFIPVPDQPHNILGIGNFGAPGNNELLFIEFDQKSMKIPGGQEIDFAEVDAGAAARGPVVYNSSQYFLRFATLGTPAGEPAKPVPHPRAAMFFQPPSPSLVTNTMKQFTCYATSHDIPNGHMDPMALEMMMVPMDQGVSMQVEECEIDKRTFKKSYIIRMVFSDLQFYEELQMKWGEPGRVKPDRMVVRLAFPLETYTYTLGEGGAAIRVREKKHQVRNLFKGYVFGTEQPVIRQMNNRGGVPRDQIAKTDDVAKSIASKLLSSQPISVSGSANFHGRAGIVPDGLVDSVSVQYTADGGIMESINFTSAPNLNDSFIGPSRIRIQDTERMQNEIIQNRLQMLNILALRNKHALAQARTVADNNLRQWGGFNGHVMANTQWGRHGVIPVVSYERWNGSTQSIPPRSVVPLYNFEDNEGV